MPPQTTSRPHAPAFVSPPRASSKAHESKHQSRHRADQNQRQINPEVAIEPRREMNQIRENVRRVWKEKQPCARQSNEAPVAVAKPTPDPSKEGNGRLAHAQRVPLLGGVRG